MLKKVNQHIEIDKGTMQTPKKTHKTPTWIKKGFAGILILLGILVLLFTITIGGLHSKRVQTYIIGKVTDRLEQILQTDVEIAQFHYRPLSHLSIDRIYLSDQQHDTLAFIEQLQAKFQPLQLQYNRIDIQQLQLKNPYLNLQSTSDSTLNFQFLLEGLKQDSSGFPFRLNIDSLALEQARIRYNQLYVDQLNLELSVPVLSQDSLEVNLDAMHIRTQMDGIDAYVEANLKGNLDSIVAEHMQLVFQDTKLFSGNITLFNPTKLDSMYINAQCETLYFNNTIIQQLLSQLAIKPITLPKMINHLGDIHYSGNIDGRIERLVLQGKFRTSLGAIDIDGEVQSDTTMQNFDIHGHIKTDTFHLGKLLDNPDLSTIRMAANIDGQFVNNKFTTCSIKSEVLEIGYKGYYYRSIELDGQLQPEEVKGFLCIKDPNIQLYINGSADWSPDASSFVITTKLKNFKPQALNLIENYPDLEIDAKLHTNLSTSGINAEILDNMTGLARIDSVQIRNGNNSIDIEEPFSIKFKPEQEEKLVIESKFLSGHMKGAFQYTTLSTTIQQILHQYLPTFIDQPTPIESNNSLDLYVQFRDFDVITEVLNLNFELPETSTIKGSLLGNNNHIDLVVNIPQFKYDKINIEGLEVKLEDINKKLTLSIKAKNHLPKGTPIAEKIDMIDLQTTLSAKNDHLDCNISFSPENAYIHGDIRTEAKLTKYKNQPKLYLKILHDQLTINDSTWNIGNSRITYTHADKVMDIRGFTLSTKHQTISAHGKASQSPTDSVCVKLKNINLNYIFDSFTDLKEEVLSIMGQATGMAKIYSIFDQPTMTANVSIPNGGLNNVYLGDVTAEAKLDKENKTILIDGQIVDSTNHLVAQIEGKVIPQNRWWGLDITCDSLDINFINKWTNGIIANPQGRAYGNVKVEGQEKLVWVTGRALAKDAQITIPYIGSTFYLTDSIFLDSTAIQFPNITIYDQYGQRGSFSGAVNHTNFLNFNYNLRATANNIMVMNLPANQQLFYGKVFATGDILIQGTDEMCNIHITNAKTEDNTKFYLNINSASQATTYDFMRFRTPNSKKSESISNNKNTNTKMTLNIEDCTIHQNADITILLGGDSKITGRGNGTLNLVYESPSNNVNMQNSKFTLLSGKFDISLANIVRRTFTIKEGSDINWKIEDPLTPTIDITAYYHTTASLRDLFGSESSQIATDRYSVPVNCVLKMTEELFSPKLNYSIELPQSDESVQNQVRSMINSDEMLMRQIIYLLLFNRFYTPEYLQNTQTIGLNETYSLLSSTLTGQINSWLSKLTDVFTMGFNFRTDGEGATASQEYEANFQFHHPNNRLIINGNFGYRYNDLSNRPFFGDFDLEYLLTDNGKIRTKAFTHTVDKYSLRQANTVQGIGFVFKHDFNWKKVKQNDSTQVNDSIRLVQDSTQVNDSIK